MVIWASIISNDSIVISHLTAHIFADFGRHHESVSLQLHGREHTDKSGRTRRGNGPRLERILERVHVRITQRSQRQVSTQQRCYVPIIFNYLPTQVHEYHHQYLFTRTLCK